MRIGSLVLTPSAQGFRFIDFKAGSFFVAKHQILVVDDDPHIREVICFSLEKAGYECSSAGDGITALDTAHTLNPALIVLDIGLPEMDGLEVCRNLRKSSEVPILFLSARDDEVDRIVGLELGADDYVTKPFSPRELVARVRAILKRYGVGTRPQEPSTAELANDAYQHGDLNLYVDQRTAELAGSAIPLTVLEFNLLTTLIHRPKVVFSREQILSTAYSDNMHVSDRTIDSHVRNIRAKFSRAGCAQVIETVHGIGFRLGACKRTRDLNDA